MKLFAKKIENIGTPRADPDGYTQCDKDVTVLMTVFVNVWLSLNVSLKVRRSKE